MIIHFLSKGSKQVGSSRYRAYQIAELMGTNGYQTAVTNISEYTQTSFINAIRLVFTLLRYKQSDIVWLQRTTEPVWLLSVTLLLKKILRYKLIFDFDDASYLFWPRTYRILTQRANQVIVGSEALLAYARQYNQHVVKIPTVIDLKDYRIKRKLSANRNKALNIVWVGTVRPHRENLTLLIKPMKQLQAFKVNFHFTLISSTNELSNQKPEELFRFAGSKYEQIAFDNWDKPKELARILSAMDVGVMPLVESEFNRGKCAFKLIEYMASGVVAIGSAVGENNVLIQNQQNGIICRTENDWFNELLRLSKDRNKLLSLSREGFNTVRKYYSIESVLPQYEQLLKAL
jgi:glycosyltransferase involved in cell wall biosynthesis